MAAPALRNSSQSSSSPTTFKRLLRIVVVACAKFARSCVSASAVLARVGKGSSVSKTLDTRGSLTAREYFGDVHDLDTALGARGEPPDVGEAGIVERAQDIGARGAHVGELVLAHGDRGVGVLDREHAAEATTGVLFGNLDESKALDVAQQRLGGFVESQYAKRVARRVVRDAVGEARTHVGDLEDVGQEFRELVRAPPDFFELVGECVVAEGSGRRGVEIAHGTDARRRG